MGGFRLTRLSMVLAVAGCWLWAPQLVAFWTAPVEEAYRWLSWAPSFSEPLSEGVMRVRVALLAGLSLSLPAFCLDAWLWLCRRQGLTKARWLALPFALASAGVLCATLWSVRLLAFQRFAGGDLSRSDFVHGVSEGHDATTRS